MYQSLSACEARLGARDTEQSKTGTGAAFIGSQTKEIWAVIWSQAKPGGGAWMNREGVTACRVMYLVQGHCRRLAEARIFELTSEK